MFIHSEPGVHQMFSPTLDTERCSCQPEPGVYKMFSPALDTERCSSSQTGVQKMFSPTLDMKDVSMQAKPGVPQMFSPTLDIERCSPHSVQKMFSSALDAERCSSIPNLEYTKCFHRHLTQKDGERSVGRPRIITIDAARCCSRSAPTGCARLPGPSR